MVTVLQYSTWLPRSGEALQQVSRDSGAVVSNYKSKSLNKGKTNKSGDERPYAVDL